MASHLTKVALVVLIVVLGTQVIIEQKYMTDALKTNLSVQSEMEKHAAAVQDGDTTTTHDHKDQSAPSCQLAGHTLFQNRIISNNVNNGSSENTNIPKSLHFFAKSKCIPNKIHHNLQLWMEAAPNHSIYLHDLDEINEHLSTPRSDMTFIPKAHLCAFDHEAILDLARFVYLYDYGGISVDIDHIPAQGFFGKAQEGTRSILLHEHDHDEKPLSFVIEEQSAHAYPRFLASTAKNPMLHKTLLKSIAAQYRQHSAWTYDSSRNNTYFSATNWHQARDWHAPIYIKHHSTFSPVGIIQKDHINATQFLQQVNLTQDERNSLSLKDNTANIKRCVDLTNDSYKIDQDALLEITGGIPDEGNCTEGMIYESNTFLPESINIPGRKIPKVVHLTAKEKCFTPSFHNNNNLWRHPGHSFFVHDNAAVDRLLRKFAWNEFPLLSETLSCVNSGAMLADVWRYLLMWKFGGIYSDIDNAPGWDWKNGTVVEDYMDAMFEVERGGFPSQYFFAISPHHPVSYFMSSYALEALLLNDKPLRRRGVAPFTTGPRACKNGIIMSIGGNGYPEKGDYPGNYNRNITMIGSPREARQRKYLARSVARAASPEDEQKMGMEHYQGATTVELPTHSCEVQMLMDLHTLFQFWNE